MNAPPTIIRTSWSALKRRDLRHHRRYAVNSDTLQVFWLGTEGTMKMARTRALNISEGGMVIELPEPAALSSRVRFESRKYMINGSGAVRHCQRVGAKYIVGLEFGERLHWQAPEGDVIEPIPLCQPDRQTWEIRARATRRL